MVTLTPRILRDAPALIESVFPAQKISVEAQAERKAVGAQTLTGLGSYWKGRKPLILVRAIVLGSLLPRTDNDKQDLEVFESLMAFDDEGLARRALMQNAIKPKDFSSHISLDQPWDFFAYTIKKDDLTAEEVEAWKFPLDANVGDLTLRWRRDIDGDKKLVLFRKALAAFGSYEEKAACCKRPEEVDQEWLYRPVWLKINSHYAYLGINAHSHQELIEQLGILRYGHRPRVGDSFCGGGSIPFEAARTGCNVYAADLSPVACMLTWGALNLVGASKGRRLTFEAAQREVTRQVDEALIALGVEHDDEGNRAKAYLYCLETRCPETGWWVPILPSRIISPKRGTVARLTPDRASRRFDIKVINDVSRTELQAAKTGTMQDGELVYELDGNTHRTPAKTLRGDYRDSKGNSKNRLRRWKKSDFIPREGDIFQERLYAIKWLTRDTIHRPRQVTYFRGVTDADMERERKVERIVAENLARWQTDGLAPDMEIEPGNKTDDPIRERGWTHWHHLFNARQLLLQSFAIKAWRESSDTPLGWLKIAKMTDFNSKLCRWKPSQDGPVGVFYNQALNTFYNYATRAWMGYGPSFFKIADVVLPPVERRIVSDTATQATQPCELWITDPPYADAVQYHEITEFFIAWLRKNPPKEFQDWIWDSRRALAIKGSGDDFRRGMIEAYRTMTEHMPADGLQCVMFTHQDTTVWSDMTGIFWAAGLQVVSAWYIATETTSELKRGGHVQGTVLLLLRKRPAGEKAGFKQRILPAVRTEVERQISTMMHLNDEVEDKMGEPVFNDSDLQMGGYAAALKVLTAYTQVGGEDVTTFAMRPRRRGEVTVVDEIVQQAAEAANSLLVPEGLHTATWRKLRGIQRFYLRMMDMESTGASKLDNYQNFAKAFRVEDYTRVMASMTANKARLKRVTDFVSRDLTPGTELGATWLGGLIIGLQQLLAETEPQVVIGQLQADFPDFMGVRPLLIDLLCFIEKTAPEHEVCQAAETLGARLRNLRALSQ